MRLCIAALVALLPAQEQLEFKPRQGDKVTSVKKMTMSLQIKVKAGEQEQTLSFEQRGLDERVREIVEVKNGKCTKLVVTVNQDYEEQREPGSEEFKRKENKLHGKKVTVSEKDGKLVYEGVEDPDAKTKKGLKLEDDFSRLFPKKKISAGDTWEVTGKELQEFMEDDKVSGTLKFKHNGVKDGCVSLAADWDVKGKTEEGIDMVMKLSGEILVSPDRGYTKSANLKGTVTMESKNENMEMTGSGPMEMTFESKW